MKSSYPKGLYPENRPQWKDAPKWAKWLALDDCGQWRWYEKKPLIIWNSFYGHWENAGKGPMDCAVRESRKSRELNSK